MEPRQGQSGLLAAGYRQGLEIAFDRAARGLMSGTLLRAMAIRFYEHYHDDEWGLFRSSTSVGYSSGCRWRRSSPAFSWRTGAAQA